MRALLDAGAVQAIKIEVFDNMLRAQGCSGLELQRLLASSGFTLYLAPADGLTDAISRAKPHPVSELHSASQPYNLYCFRPEPAPSYHIRHMGYRERRRRLSS